MADSSEGGRALQGALPSILQRAKVVISPYPFGLSDDDNLRITSENSVTGVTLEVHYRLLTRDGQVKAGVFKHTPNTNRTAKTEDFHLAGGFVTNLSVFATGGSPLIGQTFVIVQLIRGMGSVAVVLGTMLQGYVTTTQGLGWPGSAIVSSTEGEPAVRSILGTQPAVSTAILETVPTGARWELLTFGSSLTPQAGVINSQLVMTIKDASGRTISEQASSANLNAGIGIFGRAYWTRGPALNSAAGVLVHTAMPQNIALLAGSSIGISAISSEQWNAPVYTVREWLEVG